MTETPFLDWLGDQPIPKTLQAQEDLARAAWNAGAQYAVVGRWEMPAPVVPEQPQLPTEPGYYLDSIQSFLRIDPYGYIHRNGIVVDPENSPLYLPWVSLVPAGSERETDLRDDLERLEGFVDDIADDLPECFIDDDTTNIDFIGKFVKKWAPVEAALYAAREVDDFNDDKPIRFEYEPEWYQGDFSVLALVPVAEGKK